MGKKNVFNAIIISLIIFVAVVGIWLTGKNNPGILAGDESESRLLSSSAPSITLPKVSSTPSSSNQEVSSTPRQNPELLPVVWEHVGVRVWSSEDRDFEIFKELAVNTGDLESADTKIAPLVKISNADELAELTKKLQEPTAEGEQAYNPYDEESQYTIKAATYTEEFFKENTLFLVYVVEGSGSYTHNITGLDVANGALSLQISTIIPESGTCDMLYKILFIEIPNEKLEGVKTYNLTKIEEPNY